ncbi:histone deacetylase domain-containing protein 1 [Elsinoe australis]|uniref:Histone deacetylase n=1 Tax=Elsinoe australis TaxID=40998 RepID=A0A4U7BBT4_9PEZI|nr:histone deacetylase domain-containing protein 1 [Elsinoe australis]
MDGAEDGDHIMHDGPILASTEINGMITATLDPAMLSTQDEDMSSPEMSRDGLVTQNGLHFPKMDLSQTTDGDLILPSPMKYEAPSAPKYSPLPYASSRSGLVYDVRMRFHVEPIPKDTDMHPEDPRRIFEVYNELCQAGLVDDPANPELAGDYVLLRIPARHATENEILACHSQGSYDLVMNLKNLTEEELYEKGEQMDSVYLSVNTPGCALLAAGGAIEAARAVMNRQVKNSIAVIRPPGHHAEHSHPMGFCFFNNVPVAARAIQKEFGDVARKILILDWDVHHGNGVQNIFYEDPNILYISLHVSQNGAFYPAGNDKDHLHCGAGAGMGKNVNIPWKTAGMGDGDYVYAFQEVVMPIAQDFDPDLVFVCAGFDAAAGDMIGGCHVTPAGYAHMTHMLMSLADGKVVVCMEGGYNLRSIAVSALAVTRTLMGEPPERLQSSQPSPSGVDTVKEVLRQQSNFWPCLYPKDPSKRLKRAKGSRLHDLLRDWQATQLFKNYDMTALFIARNKISKSFENQILATANYNEPRPLLLTFHDPPELTGTPDPRTQRLEAHNTFLTDGVNSYIDWAVNAGFAVIDVNVPKHLTNIDDEATHSPNSDPEERSKDALTLATYLWENYIELSDAPHIFILGVGAAYNAIIELLKYNDRVPPRISKLFFFVSDQSLHSCRSATDENLSFWYYDSSLVFVAQNHHIWDYTNGGVNGGGMMRKPKKRFGTLVRSESDALEDMLVEHLERVTGVMGEISEGWEEDVKAEENGNGQVEDAMQDGSEDELTSPRRAGALADKSGSPVRLPPVGNFAISPKKR